MLSEKGDAATKEAVWNVISRKSLSELGFTADDVLSLSGISEKDFPELARQPSREVILPVGIHASGNAAVLENWTKSIKQNQEGISFQSLANLVHGLDEVVEDSELTADQSLVYGELKGIIAVVTEQLNQFENWARMKSSFNRQFHSQVQRLFRYLFLLNVI